MAGQIAAPTAAPGPMPPAAATSLPNQGAIPFARAVGEIRGSNSVQDSKTLTAATQPIQQTIPGTGYMCWLDLEMILVSTGNASTNSVALTEDAPWAAFPSITLDDGGPQIVNIDGYSLHLLNMYGGFGMKDVSYSSDANVYSAIVSGTGTGAGSGTFRLRIPAAINARDKWGILGNQDRATKYNLRDDLSNDASIFTTVPTNEPTVTINRHYGFVPVPGPQSADGRPQEQIPSTYGILHYMMATKQGELPVGGSAINHYIRNLSNAVRMFVLVLRSGSTGTPRAAAELQMPTQIDLKIGTDVIFSESTRERRQRMWDLYRIDAPKGVLVYNFINDFGPLGGYELGDNYLYLGNVSEAQFTITYPSGFAASASNSLTVVTSSLYIPPGISLYGPIGG